MPQWIRLLYWPAHLSADYGPPAVEVAQGVSISQLPGLLLLVSILAIGVVTRKRQPVIAFGIAIVCAALLPSSNFILPAGIIIAERTLFLPSVGAMLIVGGTALVVAERIRNTRWERGVATAAPVACAAVLVAGLARSVTRTPVWRDNPTLFAQSVLDEPDSYRTHYVLGTWYMEHERKSDAELEFRKGLKLFPYDPYLAFSLAEAYRTSGMCAPALPLYKLAREVDPEFPVGRSQYALCLFDQGHYDEARRMALAAVNAGGLVGRLHNVIRVIDSAQKAQRIGQGGKISMVGIPGSGGKLPDTVQKSTLRPVSNASR